MEFKPEWFDAWFERNFGYKETYSPVEIARKLNRSPEFIYRALRRAELENFRLGSRTYVVPREALRKWLLESYILNVDEEELDILPGRDDGQA